MKCNLQPCQEIFSKPINKARAATIASCKITETLLKNENKSFEKVIINKECLAVAGDSLLSEFKDKTETRNVINKVQLSQNAVCMSNDTDDNCVRIRKYVNFF